MYEEIIKKLEEKLKKNKIKIDDLEHKIQILGFSKLSRKLVFVSFIAILSLLTVYVLNALGISPLSLMPAPLAPLLTVSGSVLIGIITQKILYKKGNISEELRTISQAKNEAEKIEEIARYKIEKQQAINVNQALEESISILKCRQEIFANSKVQSDKLNLEESACETERIHDLELKSEKRLAFLTAKKELSKINYGETAESNLPILMSFGISAALLVIFDLAIIPAPYFLQAISTGARFLYIALSLTGGFSAGFIYFKKQLENYKKTFMKINAELDEDIKKELGEENLSQELKHAIHYYSETKIQAEINKYNLKNSMASQDDLPESKEEKVTPELMHEPFDREEIIKEELIPVLKRTLHKKEEFRR